MNNFIKNNEACVFIRLYDQINNIELNDDYILPDYMADIKKIISVTPAVRRSGSFISGGALEYDGEVVFSVLYITEDDRIRNVSYSGEYEGALPVEGADEDCVAMLLPECAPPAYKLSNPRKINIKATVKLSATVYCRKCVSPKITGRHTPEDEMSLERRESELQAMLVYAAGESAVSVSDDITVDSTHPQVAEIISAAPEFYIYEAKISDGALSYRGDILVTCLYAGVTGEEGAESYNVITKKLAVSGSIDAGEARDGCECMPVVICSPLKAEPVKNSADEMRVIELDFSYDIVFLCSCTDLVSVVSDSYSIDCDCENRYGEHEVMRQGKNCRVNFSVNESSPSGDAGIAEAAELLYIGAQLSGESASLDEMKNKIIVEANVRFNVAAKSSDGTPVTGAFERPVKLELDGMQLHSPVEFKLSTSVLSLRGRIDQSNIYADMELGINIGGYEASRERLIDTIQLDKSEKSRACGGRYPITLYYPGCGEKLWDIAKKYNTTVSAVKSANALTSDDLPEGAVLVIPRGGIKPIFSRLL